MPTLGHRNNYQLDFVHLCTCMLNMSGMFLWLYIIIIIIIIYYLSITACAVITVRVNYIIIVILGTLYTIYYIISHHQHAIIENDIKIILERSKITKIVTLTKNTYTAVYIYMYNYYNNIYVQIYTVIYKTYCAKIRCYNEITVASFQWSCDSRAMVTWQSSAGSLPFWSAYQFVGPMLTIG